MTPEQFSSSTIHIAGTDVPTLTYKDPTAQFIYIGIAVKYGRWDEAVTESAHCIEHLLFEGTKNFPERKLIYDHIIDVGGIIYGGTTDEYTYYYIKIAKEFDDRAINLLTDMIFQPTLEYMKKAKDAIFVELGKRKRDDRYRGGSLIYQAMFTPESRPYREDIDARLDSLQALNREDIQEIYRANYRPEQMIILLGGNVSAKTVEMIRRKSNEKYTGHDTVEQVKSTTVRQKNNITIPIDEGSELFVFGIHAPNVNDQDNAAFNVLTTIIGGSGSSPIPRVLREVKGISYSTRAQYIRAKEGSILKIIGDCKQGCLATARQTIIEELHKIINEGVTEEQVQSVQTRSKGRILIQEETVTQMEYILNAHIARNQLRTPFDAVQEIAQVTVEQVNTVAKNYILPALEKKEFSIVEFVVSK